MIPVIIDFANVLLAALLVGALFALWLILNPAGLDASSYVGLQQQGIRTLNTAMPALGGATIVMTIAAAILGRDDGIRFWLLIATLTCFVVIGLVTKLFNQPINAIVMTWKKDSPPANWTNLRDQWWRWHSLRLVFGLTGLCLLIAAMLKRR